LSRDIVSFLCFYWIAFKNIIGKVKTLIERLRVHYT